MSSISSQESLQAELIGRVIHPVKKCMARWAEYPHLFRRCVLHRTPRPIPAVVRFVRYIQNARLATRLTFMRGIRVPRIEPLQVSVWAKFLSGLCIV